MGWGLLCHDSLAQKQFLLTPFEVRSRLPLRAMQGRMQTLGRCRSRQPTGQQRLDWFTLWIDPALPSVPMKLSRLVLLLAVVAAILLLLAGPGTRMEWWDFRTGFKLLRWATFGGLGAAVLATIGLLVPRVRRGGARFLVLALVIGLAVAYMPLQGMRTAKSVPPIHDISTDTEQPPAFVEILPLRGDASNPSLYPGAEVASQQRAAYPDLQPLRLEIATDAAFDRALEAAKAMGWEMVSADKASGRIEATDTTFWFGFKDDVVVRVQPEGGASVIDVRSVSRVGQSDVGKNAQRIRQYLEKIEG